MRDIITQGARFLIAGLLNTAVTLVLYQLLLFAMNAELAYAFTWIAGMGIVIVFYPDKVFDATNVNRAKKLQIGAIYIASFVLGLVCINTVSQMLGWDRAAILFAMGVTTIVNFVGMRLVLRHT